MEGNLSGSGPKIEARDFVSYDGFECERSFHDLSTLQQETSHYFRGLRSHCNFVKVANMYEPRMRQKGTLGTRNNRQLSEAYKSVTKELTSERTVD